MKEGRREKDSYYPYSLARRLSFSLVCFIGFSVASKPSGSCGDFQLLVVEEDPTCTNIGILSCIGRTNDAPLVSWKTSPR